jgi:hypothetical protein
LSPTDQDALVKQIGLALMRTAPDDWQQISAEFRATGRYYELSADVTDSDGNRNAWTASHDIAMHFAKLRAGMYRDGRGTWFNARYLIEKPSSYNLEFDRQEPTWRTPPPVAAFRDELHFFPRTEENVPDWLLRKLSGLSPERPGRRFRLARIFDGTAPNGRPSVNRPAVPDDDRDRLLEYLDHSAMALPERGHDLDRLSSDGRPTVPVAFHTDGVWVWPAAVNYYLRRYGVPPDPELVNHARSNGFRPPEVDDQTRAAAAATITGGRPPGPPRPAGPPGGPGPGAPGPGGPGRQGPPPAAVTPIPAAVAAAGPGAMDLLSGAQQQAGPPPAVPQPLAAQLDDAAPGGAHSVIEDDDHDELDQHGGLHDHRAADEPAPPVVPPPVRSGSQQERTLNLLNRRLADLRVPESAYRIGEPAPQTWYLEQVDDGWQVGWFDGEFSSPMLFEEVADASAFLLGKVLLGVPAESALHDPIPAPPAHQMATHDDEDEPVGLVGVDEDDEHQHATPAAHELATESPQHAMEPTQHGMEPSLDQVEDDELEQPEPAHEMQHDMAREPMHEIARDLPQRDPRDLARDLPQRDPRDLPQRDLPRRDPPQHDLGQHDLGQRDLGQHDLGQHDLGQRDLGQREMAQRDLARDMVPVPPPVVEPPHPDLPEPVPAMNNHVNNRVQESVAPPPMQQQPPQQQQQPMQQAPMQGQTQQGQQGPPPEWPIQPLAGEPPLTLFRGKRLLELQPGTEVDRFGSPEGNLTYVAGTPFEQRSLVPDWVHRPYHMYRVTRPVQALTGGAIPWFDQPGGGTAYLLARAIDELVGTGELVEIEPAEPPVS